MCFMVHSPYLVTPTKHMPGTLLDTGVQGWEGTVPAPEKFIIQCGELDLRVYRTRWCMNNRLSEGWFLSFSPRLTCIGINWEVCSRRISAPLLPHESESLGVELGIHLFNMPCELLYCRHFDSNTTIRWKRKASFEYWCWRNSLQGLWCWVWSWLLFYNRWFWTILFLVKHLILASDDSALFRIWLRSWRVPWVLSPLGNLPLPSLWHFCRSPGMVTSLPVTPAAQWSSQVLAWL